MLSELKELWKFRELLYTMVQRELKIRYKNSALGFFWSMLNPLITVLVMTLAFQFMNRGGQATSVPSMTAYLLAGYLPFTFFQLSLMDSAQTILTAMPLIKKIYFPREILPLASVIGNFIHLLMGMAVFFFYLGLVYLRSVILNHGFQGAENPFQFSILLLPMMLIINLMLSIGLALFVSAFNTFYEDVKYIVGVLTFLMLFLCPILYMESDVANNRLNLEYGGWIFKIMNLNPVFTLVTDYRKILVAPPRIVGMGNRVMPVMPLSWTHLAFTAVLCFLIMVYGYHAFNRLKWRFVERP